MSLVQIILVGLYSFFLLFIFAYSLMQANLVVNYVRSRGWRKKRDLQELDLTADDLPMVTIQLPVYNELYVVERLIDSITEFKYPTDRFEIQVLDDSNDETVDIIAKKVAQVQQMGIDIQHVRRADRKGFKAGALAYGMTLAKGEFIAIFDADFVPKPEFLIRTLSYFQNKEVGVVQTRWEHINRDYSILTRMQAFGLDAHFSVEQGGRNAAGHFINFNGTAGIWRKTTIEDAGGWESDTLTEDLDLSYRAQMKGWQFIFLEGVGSPAELPAAMNALKTQQFRWTKGAAECAKKNLWSVITSKELSFSTKLHGTFHLMNSFLFICIISTALLSVPMLQIKASVAEFDEIFRYGAIFLFSTLLLSIFYWFGTLNEDDNTSISFLKFLVKFPIFLSISMGLSLHNAIAVMEGYIGRKTPFIRTPKFNIQKNSDTWRKNKYLTSSINLMSVLEAILALYFLGAVVFGIWIGDWGLLPFHIMLFGGFTTVSLYSFNHSRNLAGA